MLYVGVTIVVAVGLLGLYWVSKSASFLAGAIRFVIMLVGVVVLTYIAAVVWAGLSMEKFE